MRPKSHSAELHALHEAIKISKATVPCAPSTESAPPIEANRDESELVAALREFKDGLVQMAESADDIIGAHPATSVGAAFLLGLAVGRLTRGI